MRVFLFFALQLVIRIVFSFFYLKYPDTRKELIIFDIAGSVLIYLIAFFPFIRSISSGILG